LQPSRRWPQASGEWRQQQSLCLFLRAYAMLNGLAQDAANSLQQAFAEADRMRLGFRPVPEVAGRLSKRRRSASRPHRMRASSLRSALVPPGYSAAWPWTARVTTLGRFQLIVNDGRSPRGKLPRKTLELLQYVAGSPSLTVAVDRLTASLWPELEGDLARGAFRTALHRLRKLLDDPQAIAFDGASVRIDPARVWVDALAFERLVDAVERQLQRGEGAPRA
jgi:DNA-binding SARP family transcriptional activator